MDWPEWAVCYNSLVLFTRGVKLPEGLKLSKKAAQEVKRIRSWAEAVAETIGPAGGAKPAGGAFEGVIDMQAVLKQKPARACLLSCNGFWVPGIVDKVYR